MTTSNYYAAKFERESKDKPSDHIIDLDNRVVPIPGGPRADWYVIKAYDGSFAAVNFIPKGKVYAQYHSKILAMEFIRRADQIREAKHAAWAGAIFVIGLGLFCWALMDWLQ